MTALLLMLLAVLGARAQGEIPPELAPWVPWVLAEHPTLRCPVIEEEAACLWPGRLDLDLAADGGAFALRVQADRLIEAPLPGGAGAWPQGVTVDGAPAVVLDRGAGPAVVLGAGQHLVRGAFSWAATPRELPIPAAIGQVKLTLDGEVVREPRREGGLLRLGSGAQEAAENQVEAAVFRKVTDGVPLRVTTRIELRIAGSGREIDLGAVLPPQTRPVALTADLPARLTEAGTLQVQARPGSFTLEIEAVADGPAEALAAPSPGRDWPAQEFWAVQLDDAARAVDLAGPAAVDPTRTGLPEGWRGLPTFLVRPGESLQLKTLRRGEPDPAPDRLTLRRELWLDSDGGGLTVRDTWSGQLHRGWRMEALPPAALGHASANGEDQVITLSADGRSGVELRAAALEMVAESRIEGRPGRIPAVGWAADVDRLEAMLNLPPGWTLLHAAGVDSGYSLLEQWSLLDVFLVALLSLAAGRLLGWRWGLVALAGLALGRQELWEPTWAVGAALVALALERAIPGRGTRWLRRVAAGILLLAAAIFCAEQLESGLFPALERPHASAADGIEEIPDRFVELQMQAPAEEEIAETSSSRGSLDPSAGERANRKGESKEGYLSLQVDPDAVVQTGPGVPGWMWEVAPLSWSGPVTAEQELRLVLLSPLGGRILALLRVALALALALRLAGVRRLRLPPREFAAAIPLLLACPLARAAPDPALLQELTERLTSPPACLPDCVETPLIGISIGETLVIEAEVHAAAPAAWALPGPLAAWSPESVTIDDQPAVALTRRGDGFLLVRLDPGVHRVRAVGPAPAAGALALQLAEAPQQMDFQSDAWTITGLRPDGRAEPLVQLSRLAGGEAAGPARSQENLAPWLEVRRYLDLGIPWRVRTDVRRLGGAASPLSLTVPLLPGEAVTTDGVRVEGGAAQITLDAGQTELSWLSTLQEQPTLTLTAPEGVPWFEEWALTCSPVFRCEPAGLAPLRHVQEGLFHPLWRPWPGESVALTVARPDAAAGQTTTIDRADLQVVPGQRLAELTLTLRLRASRGGQQAVTLPPDAKLQSIRIDGQDRPLQPQGGEVLLPLRPGQQEAVIAWQQPHAPRIWDRVPAVDLGGAAVNVHVRVRPAPDRWIWWLSGPEWGPVAWWWSRVALALLAAVLLSRAPRSPLGIAEWAALLLGMLPLPLIASGVAALWLLALSWRRHDPPERAWAFNLAQLGLLLLSLVALGCLYAAVHVGLLYPPDAHVQGNGSSASDLAWYLDRTEGPLPRPALLSLPLWTWRVLCLAWALWLAGRLLRWLPWAWGSLGTGGVVRGFGKRPPPPPPAEPPAEAGAPTS